MITTDKFALLISIVAAFLAMLTLIKKDESGYYVIPQPEIAFTVFIIVMVLAATVTILVHIKK